MSKTEIERRIEAWARREGLAYDGDPETEPEKTVAQGPPPSAPRPSSVEPDYSNMSVAEMKAESRRLAQESPAMMKHYRENAKAELLLGLEAAVEEYEEETIVFETVDEDGYEGEISTTERIAAHIAALRRLGMSPEESQSVLDLVGEDAVQASIEWDVERTVLEAAQAEGAEIDRRVAEDLPALESHVADLVSRDRYRSLDADELVEAVAKYHHDLEQGGYDVDMSAAGMQETADMLASRYLFQQVAIEKAEAETEIVREGARELRLLNDRSEDEWGEVVYREALDPETGEAVRVPIMQAVSPDLSEDAYRKWSATTGDAVTDLINSTPDEQAQWANDLEAKFVAQDEALIESYTGPEAQAAAEQKRANELAQFRAERGYQDRPEAPPEMPDSVPTSSEKVPETVTAEQFMDKINTSIEQEGL